MKQQILNLKKKLLLVELPEGAESVLVEKSEIHYIAKFLGVPNIRQFTRLISPVNLIGKLTDITEEQFSEWVEQEFDTYRDYRHEDSVGSFILNTRKESFFSYLEANKVCFENRMPKPTKEKWGYSRGIWTWDEGKFHYNNELKIYKAFQEYVWDIERCWIFEIV